MSFTASARQVAQMTAAQRGGGQGSATEPLASRRDLLIRVREPGYRNRS